MVARTGGEEGDRPMDMHTYASVVEDNYQRLADVLLSTDPDASKVQRLLALDLLPAPPIPRGYAIWSEGLLAAAFAYFPTAAFPALWKRLRTATANEGISRLSKALTMWGDRFATALVSPGQRATRSDCKRAPSTASPSTPKGSTSCAMRKRPR